MSSGKFIISGTAILTSALFITSATYPQSLVMTQADDSLFFQVIRVLIVGFMVALLVTEPPRSLVLRRVIGGFAAVLALLSIQLYVGYALMSLDAVVFMLTAIIFGIEALEDYEVKKPARRIRVVTK